MPETPQPHTPDLYDLLGELQHEMANCCQMTGYALDLKASADRLLPLVSDALQRVKVIVDRALPLLPDGRGG